MHVEGENKSEIKIEEMACFLDWYKPHEKMGKDFNTMWHTEI